ncbi:endonuclease NucS domain-containing protein [Celeribacter sp. PS-C1]|uniref:endonuclease NucS domain-containing protein n=1 Tax=Celeribacter sp. PS-C1 TaxID=2820813 RepID=UPI001CA50185|nr:endonuclease NucS domain-containing protein [Celeribacter sp. PS-C1]MBW6419359.1 DUF91 domain-containing protein [Celeribacter sp. PS-C1]
MSKQYKRIMLGRKSVHAAEGIAGNYIGAGFLPEIDLSDKLPDEWRVFNKAMIPVFLAENPGKSKVAAGLACGMLHTICKGMKKGDVVMTPDQDGNYHFGEITGDYYYDSGAPLPHKRPVHWFDTVVHRNDLSDPLQYSIGSIGTVSSVEKHQDEIEAIIGNRKAPVLMVADETIEDPSVFALEKHLEDFLVANWPNTPLGRTHDIYTVDGEIVGQQFPSDTGPIDILAISKDGSELLIVELKKGRASDSVVGQIQRYMGYVLSELAENTQTVRGAIIALDNDKRIEHALRVAPNIDFYRYQIRFDLEKVTGA